jgi:hypothetical protein
MNTTKIDISGLNRIELAELRDEIVFELDLHDAELRAFYGTTTDGPMLGAAFDEDVWCPVCEDRESETVHLRAVVEVALRTLLDGKQSKEERMVAAIEHLEQEQ